MDALLKLSTRLAEASVNRFYNPFSDFDWPAQLQSDKLPFAPALSTLNYLPAEIMLSEEQRKSYLLLECVNFFSLNIHGEKALIAGISGRLHRDYPNEISQYLHHFLDEENKHMAVFARFCQQYGGRLYPSKKLNIPSEMAEDAEDLLFFSRIVIFEQIADHYNRAMMADGDIDSTVKRIHRMHHQDESRHLAFGREWVVELFGQRSANWNQKKRNFVSDYLINYCDATWREYYNPYFMRDAGVTAAYNASRAAFECPAARAFRSAAWAPCRDYFVAHEILRARADGDE